MTLHRGKIAREPTITNVRALTRDDLMLLKVEKGERASPPNLIAKLRDPHHRLARLIAAGLKLNDAAERAGYSYSGAHRLSCDPAFKELVAKYRTMVDEAFVREADTMMELATSNMIKAERMLAEKIELADEEGIPLPTRDLIAISGDRMDRFGYGKRQTNLNVNADFASLLEKARQRSSRVIDATPVGSGSAPTPQGQLVESPAFTPSPEAPPLPSPKLLRRV